MEILETKNSNNGMILSMNDEEKNENMSIGLFLKLAREKKSLSIDAISRHTKISSTNLEYLESNNKKALPNVAYVKGFVKSYCKIVDIDLDYALTLLDELYKIKPAKIEVKEQIKIINEYAPTPKKQEAPKNYNNIYKATAAILLLATAITIISTRKSDTNTIEEKVQVENESEEISPISLSKTSPLQETDTPALETTAPALAAEEAEVINIEIEKAPAPTPVEKIEVKAPVAKPVEKTVKAETEAPKKEKIELKDKIEFYSFPYPLYKIDANSKEEISYVPLNYRNSLTPELQNVFITAVDGDSWITYKKDADPVKKFVLKQGRFIMIRGNDIRLFLGNVNATKIFLNNNLLDVSTTSSVKSLVFPQELAKNLKLPLFVFKKDGTAITSQEFIDNNQED